VGREGCVVVEGEWRRGYAYVFDLIVVVMLIQRLNPNWCMSPNVYPRHATVVKYIEKVSNL